ncbi:hypothetical protein LCGC14_0540010 [marine sediment metagenome]|uniref:Uncharacterized protein n=1 Tax=marine sediment metagenome TaxID=412755 RepID=A0A0F9RXN7_9ZZZZ
MDNYDEAKYPGVRYAYEKISGDAVNALCSMRPGRERLGEAIWRVGLANSHGGDRLPPKMNEMMNEIVERGNSLDEMTDDECQEVINQIKYHITICLYISFFFSSLF